MVARGAVVGVSGALSVFVIDSVLSRIPALNGSPSGRAAVRLVSASIASIAADSIGAPGEISAGILAGPVMVTTLDLGVAMVGRSRVDPPPVLVSQGPEALGAPWPQKPLYAAGKALP